MKVFTILRGDLIETETDWIDALMLLCYLGYQATEVIFSTKGLAIEDLSKKTFLHREGSENRLK